MSPVSRSDWRTHLRVGRSPGRWKRERRTGRDGSYPSGMISSSVKAGALNTTIGSGARSQTPRTAAALASENKVLAHPASVDTIPTSANTEDHVSMGPAAALQARQIVANVERILALELFAAAQAIDFRREALGPEARLGQGTAPAYELIRQRVPFLDQDEVMYPHMEAVRELVASGELMRVVKDGLVQESTDV